MPRFTKGTYAEKYGIKAMDVARLLGKAGWTWRNGRGDHIVITKAGRSPVTLADPISADQWKRTERVLGTELETLWSKAPPGKARTGGLGEAEWRRRLSLAAEMSRIGFSLSYILKHAGVAGLRAMRPDFDPALLETMTLDQAMERWFEGGSVKGSVQRPTIESAQRVTLPASEPVSAIVSETEEASVEATPDDVSAVLELLQEQSAQINQLVSGRAERAAAYAERLRIVGTQLSELRSEMERRLDVIMGELREFR